MPEVTENDHDRLFVKAQSRLIHHEYCYIGDLTAGYIIDIRYDRILCGWNSGEVASIPAEVERFAEKLDAGERKRMGLEARPKAPGARPQAARPWGKRAPEFTEDDVALAKEYLDLLTRIKAANDDMNGGFSEDDVTTAK
jgi:hypothetical protein